jgi:hypothetical protein
MTVLLVCLAVAVGAFGWSLGSRSESRLGQFAGFVIVAVGAFTILALLASNGADTGGD